MLNMCGKKLPKICKKKYKHVVWYSALCSVKAKLIYDDIKQVALFKCKTCEEKLWKITNIWYGTGYCV